MNKNKGGFFEKLNKSFVRVSLKERIMFTKHLSMMIKSGMTEIESIRLVQRQVKSKGFKLILNDMIVGLENGQFLSATLRPYEKIFGGLFISIVALGEVSGTLAENLSFLAEELRESQKIKSKVHSALVYPAIILVATIGVVGALVLFVLPRILPIFDTLGASLPLPTRILITSADFLKEYFLLLIAGGFVAFIIMLLLSKIKSIKYIFNRILLSLPFAGNISKQYNMSNITRTLGILLRSGVKIVEAVISTSNISESLVYKKALLDSAENIKKGEPLFESLEKHPRIFLPTVTRMIEVGEKTGNLDENLKYLSEFYKNEVDETVANLSSILEPVLLLFMGGLVGFVAISIITPIYQITQAF